MADKGNRKGARAEEAMRLHFRKLGYFGVRAIPYSFGELSVTDIDLWLYRPAGVFRERINVDIKCKQKPQAIERILWATGVTQVLRLDQCVVVTTETHPAVMEFGKRSNVTVVDGKFLQHAIQNAVTDRLSEEDFCNALRPNGAEEKGKQLRWKYEGAKKRLLNLSYDGCNLHLLDIRACMEDLYAYPGMAQSVRRLLYVLISYWCITLDYLISKSEFLDDDKRRQEIETGLRYGSAGRQRLDDFVRTLESCKKNIDRQSSEVISSIVYKLREEAGGVRADTCAEYIMRQIGPAKLFDLARDFEEAAFGPTCPTVSELPVELKSLLMVLVDFYGLERSKALSW